MERNLYKNSYSAFLELQKTIFTIAGIILLVCICITGFLRLILFPVSVPSVSMEPELAAHSMVWVTPLTGGERSFPHLTCVSRGDVVYIEPLAGRKLSVPRQVVDSFVSFFTFQRWSPFSSSGKVTERASVRRVLGMPGDTVYVKDYILHIKPAGETHFLTEFELIKDGYDIQIETLPPEWLDVIGSVGSMDEIVLKENEYFVMADNRTSAVDSRIWGGLPGSLITGKVLMCYFPLRSFGIK